MTAEEFRNKCKTKAGRKTMAFELNTLFNSQGWEICYLIMNEEKRNLEAIVKDLKVKGEDLQDARIRLHYIDRILGMPESLIEQLSKNKEEFSVYTSEDRTYD